MQTVRADHVTRTDERPGSRYTTFGGTRIHYCVEGRGPALVLLHGLVGSVQVWDGWVEQLADHYRIIRIDLPGFGLSEHLTSDDYTSEHAVALLEHVRTQLHLERFHLAGHSLGGALSAYYAALHPERVEKLILIDPLGYPQKLPSLLALLSLPLLGELAGWVTPRFVVARHLREAYGNGSTSSDALVERMQRGLARRSNRRAMVQTFRRMRGYKEDGDSARLVPRIRAATLVMWGERDRWAPLSLLAAWRRDLPGAQVKTYARAGHFLMEELAEQTARDAHAFLAAGEKSALSGAPRVADGQVVPFVFARGA